MKKYKTASIETKIVDEVLCNKCGDSCIGEYNILGLDADIWGSYGSTHLEDLVGYSFNLCEKCLVELFNTFKIPVEKAEPYWNFQLVKLICQEYVGFLNMLIKPNNIIFILYGYIENVRDLLILKE